MTQNAQSSEPDRVLEINAEIVGMSVSPDQDILYVHMYGILDINSYEISAKPDIVKTNDDYYVIKKINLLTLDTIGIVSFAKDLCEVQRASKVLPVLIPNYLCISKNFIASTSEDFTVYIWDRHHNILVNKLHAPTKLGKYVNSVAFDPKNEEIFVTAHRSGLLVWNSKHLQRESGSEIITCEYYLRNRFTEYK